MNNQPYQVMPALTAEEYAALRDDIAANGIRVPVDVDEDGTVLDGHHRAAIARELGIDYPTRVVVGLTEEEKRHHALAVNLTRRHLTREQRRGLIVAELEYDPSRSDRAISRLLGCDHKTVGAVRREMRGEIPHDSPLTREDAERITERLRDDTARWDQEIALCLLRGVPPAMLAGALVTVQREGERGLADREFADVMWRHFTEPRISAILAWPTRGFYAEQFQGVSS